MKKTIAALAAFVVALAVGDGLIDAGQPSAAPAYAAEMQQELREEHLLQQGLRSLVNPHSRIESALAEAEGR